MIERAAQSFNTPGGPQRATPDEQQRYQIHVYQNQQRNSSTVTRDRDTAFKSGGDCLTVLAIGGPDQLAVSIGARDNPFIPIREGMIFPNRPFEEFRVRVVSMVSAPALFTPETVAIFASSYGPLLQHPGFKRRLFEPGAFTVTSAVGAVAVDLLSIANIKTLWGLSTSGAPSLLRWGGTLRVHNRDNVTPVFLYFGNPTLAPPIAAIGVSATLDQISWQIDPGQKEEFVFESGILWNVKSGSQINDNAFKLSMFAQTLGPTVTVATLFGSAIRDLTDLDVQNIGVERPLSIGGA